MIKFRVLYLASLFAFVSNAQNNISNLPSIFPLDLKENWQISSSFGYRIHPITYKKKMHKGLDIASKEGTFVFATANGIVKESLLKKGYGELITIEHPNNYQTKYAHLYIRFVEKGEKVKRGDTIALVGTTGHSTGYHLHYEVIHNNTQKDPAPFLFLQYSLD